ncbi:FAD:protein FMN transferase [Shewanella sp. GXUN23E]|uniref:FAD:protein FMN transferase n=1 Tax=Shewanella sp. GXUN23E TaxID=3422498 RepID=UPI003D7D9E66
MASPCELLFATQDKKRVASAMQLAVTEARRIESKYSRFLEGNPLWHINHSQGKPLAIDSETFSLLDFARQCYQLSDGKFDVSAGPLMRLWRFDGSHRLPSQADIEAACDCVGFNRIAFDEQSICLPAGMSLDFGGIGKEYAVDRVASLLAQRWPKVPVLVNFGGDIACPVSKLPPWQVGIENPSQLDSAGALLSISQGALATSGDTRRFVEVAGKRYGHIIDPLTGYPVPGAPRSVTVLGPNCVAAGMLATMAMLQGDGAEDFLAAQGVEFQLFRQEMGQEQDANTGH